MIDISVKYDNRDTQKPGFKFAEWELKGKTGKNKTHY